MLSVIQWSGGPLSTGTNFENPTNWMGGVLPGPADDAVIGSSFASNTITSAASATIHSLASKASFQILAGTFTVGTTVQVDNTFTLGGGTLTGATIQPGSGGQGLICTSSGGTLDGVTANADLDLTANSARVGVTNGLTLNGTLALGSVSGSAPSLNFQASQTLGGSGSVVFGTNLIGGLNVTDGGASPATLTIGAGITIHGGNGCIGTNQNWYSNNGTSAYFQNSADATIINQGTISADTSGGAISVGGGVGNVVNAGTLQATGGGGLSVNGTWTSISTITATGATLSLGDQSSSSTNAWSNTGTITATNSTVNLGGSLTVAALGTLNRTGGTVNLTGTLDDTATTLALDATSGSWNLAGGTIRGGTVMASDGAELVFTDSGGTLDGVTAASDLDLATNNNANVHIVDGLTLNNATVYVGNASGTTYGQMLFDTSETLAGTGTVLFGKNGNNAVRVWNGSGATLTIGSGITVRGSSGTLGQGWGNGTIVNQGTIAADDSGGLVGGFANDTGFGTSYGWTGSTGDVIDTSGVTNPAPQAVYQTWREGRPTYALGNLTPGASYTVRLDFADSSSTAAGQRQFNVGINGTQVLTNFDIFATAGGQDKAVRETFTATADANGQITVNFSQGAANYPLVNGIEVLSGSTAVQAINCGLLPGGTITIGPGTFTNQGSLQASHGETLNVNGLGGNLGVAQLSGTGSNLTLGGSNYVVDQGLSAPAGTTLSLNGTWTNASTITATGATLNVGDQSSSSTNAWSNTGTINETNSTVNLGGLFTVATLGTFNRTGGTVNLTGTLDNTGTTLALNAATGSWNLAGGTLKNGTLSGSGGAELVFTNSAGTLDGVTAGSDLDLATNNSANVHIVDGLTLNNVTVRLGNTIATTAGQMYFDSTETLGGTGTVLFGKSGGNGIYAQSGTTLTIGPGITVQGSSGTLGSYWGSSTIINQGTIAADDSGGLVGGFADDTGFSSGYTGSTSDAIDTSGVSNPAPQAVYQTGRWGPSFSYTLGSLTPGASYTVRLHFAQSNSSLGSVGRQQFNVGINGAQVLTNFDIIVAAGGADKAVVEAFTTTADANGQITITFSQGASDNPQIMGIEVLSGSTVMQAINCGLLPGGTITVNPSAFTNQGRLQASNGETMNVNNLTGNLATASVTDAGSQLIVGGANWVNNLPLSAPTGTTLTLNGTWTNISTIVASGATLNLGNGSNAWSNTGTINATNSTVNLGGNFTLVGWGAFNRVGGAVNLTGTLDLLPVAPTGLWGTEGENWVWLRWADNAVTEAGYKIERSTDGVNFTQIGTVGANVTSYNDTGLSSGTTYYYRVRAYSQLGDSPYSSSVSVTPGVLGNGLLAQYFNNLSFSAPAVVTRVDGNVDVDWGGGTPDPRVNAGQFSGRWNGQLQAQYSETYTFDASQDDRVKVWVNGQLVVNHWDGDPANSQLALVAGQKYDIRVDYQEDYGGGDYVHVYWSSASTPKQIIPASCLYVPSGVGASLSANIPGPSVTVIGGSTLALNATTGSWNLVGGTIRGGNINEVGGAELVFTSSGGMLDGVTANSDLDLATNDSANVHIVDGLTLNGVTVRLGNATGRTAGQVYFDTTETLGGTGTVLFGKSGGNALRVYNGSGATLTIGPSITVRGSSGTLGQWWGNGTIVNQGTIAADDSGGASSFAYDTDYTSYYTGTDSTSDAIDTSGVSNPAPAVVYQTDRWGYAYSWCPFTYTLGNLTPEATYTVRLHFAELVYNAAGQRQFNVSINGTQVLTNFDIVATAGGKDKAVVEEFTATADANGQIAVNFGRGAVDNPMVNGIELLSGSTVVQAINCGQVAGGTITINPSTFTDQGTLQAVGSTLAIYGSVAIDGSNHLSSNTSGTITISGNLLGNLQSPAFYTPQGSLILNGSGTAAAPQLLEVMGHDVGLDPSGFTGNFAYGTLALASNTYVKLVDQSPNTTSGTPEALYVNSLIVPTGATLDLNGLHLYSRAAQIDGTIVGGTLNQIPDSALLTLNTPSPGAINPAGQLDEWSFFERAGRSVTVLVDPGSGAASGPASPGLGWVLVRLLDTMGNVLATADNRATGFGTIVTLNGVLLPTDGTYKIQIQTPTGHTAATGNYVVTTWDATPNEFPLNLDQTVTGGIVSAASVDHWNFSAVAGQQVQFHLVSAAPGIAFRLTGPGGFVGFDNLQGDSPLVTLSASGNYVLTAYGLGGQTGNYASCLWQISQTDLALDTPYNGTLAGSGQAQLFRVNVPAGEFLHVTLSDSTSADSNEVYLKFGLPPTRSDFDYRYSAVGSANQDVWALNSNPGLWYVLVYGAAVPAASSYTLTATAENVAVTSFSPNHTGTITKTVITLAGAGFGASTTVSLVAADGTAYPAAVIQATSSKTLSATFNAGTVPAGVYSLSVSKAGGTPYVLPDAFTVVQGGLPHLVTSVTVPNPIGWHIGGTVYVQYSNTGDAAMPAPLLVLTAAQNGSAGAWLTLDASKQCSGYWTSAAPDGYSHSVQFLASGSTPGLLQPGESVQVPVYYAGWDLSLPHGGPSPIIFTVGVLDNTVSVRDKHC